MPVPKKKRTTSTTTSPLPDPTSLVVPNPQEFHQHLRALAQSAVKQVIETVMIEELDALIGAAWGECSPKRKGYRNASYTRDLITSTGKLEDVKVPRDREGQFHTQAFERYQRFEPHIAEGLTQMDVARNQHPEDRRRGPNAARSGSQREHEQPLESDSHPAI